MIRAEKLQNGVLHLALNDPQKGNAIGRLMGEAIISAINTADEDPEVRCIVISGEGSGFCAGVEVNDISQSMYPDAPDPARKALIVKENIRLFGQEPVNVLEKCIKPIIAVVHGFCIGFAVDFITACDIRICSDDLRLQVKEVEVGLAADVGTLQRLPQVTGNQSWARELIYTARLVGAEECVQNGLFTRKYQNKQAAMEAALALAGQIAENSPLAVSGCKVSMIYTRDYGVQEGLQHIALWNSFAVQGQDTKIGIDAAMKRQKPVFPNL